MSKKEDKHEIEVLLRCFKNEAVNFNYSVEYLLDIIPNSSQFNFKNFMVGFMSGGIVGILILNYVL